MSFRTKILAVFTLTVVAVVAAMAWGYTIYSRQAFEQFDRQRSEALLAQFRREYAQRAEEIARRVQSIADAEATLRLAMELSRPQADASQYYNDGHGIAQSQQLDYFDIVTDDGSLITSAEWPARVGYKNEWVGSGANWNSQGAFLRRVELVDGVELGLLAVREVRVGEKRLFLIGGQRFDQDFLATLVLTPGMRALLYQNLQPAFSASALSDARGAVSRGDLFSPLIAEVQRTRGEVQQRMDWTADGASNSENMKAIPLLGHDNELLGMFLVGSSRQDLVQMLDRIKSLALVVIGVALCFTLLLGWWLSAGVSRPLEEIQSAMEAIGAGSAEARIERTSGGEIGQLATAFNDMAAKIADQRQRSVQTERVMAWRELARRLTHELKDPMLPLQLSVESLRNTGSTVVATSQLAESAATLSGELEKLKGIINRFSEFAKMPTPEFSCFDLNDLVRTVVKSFEPQLSAVGRPPTVVELYLDENLPFPQADCRLVRQAIENLVINSLQSMPAGGTLVVRTTHDPECVRVAVSDTGSSESGMQRDRLFTPFFAGQTQIQSAGLGLAIVQAVVCDHGGKVEVDSATGAGASIRLELPIVHNGGQNSGAHAGNGHAGSVQSGNRHRTVGHSRVLQGISGNGGTFDAPVPVSTGSQPSAPTPVAMLAIPEALDAALAQAEAARDAATQSSVITEAPKDEDVTLADSSKQD